MERRPQVHRIRGRARNALKHESLSHKVWGHSGGLEMKDAKDAVRVVGIVLLCLFVLVVGVPLILAAAGVTLGIFHFVVALAIGIIKLAVVLAIIYLVLVGIRSLLR